MTRILGYVRVSTPEQNPALQIDALKAAGADEIFEDRASGAKVDRPGLVTALAALTPGDTLAVWKMDRLGRSLRQLIDTIETIRDRGAFFKSLTDSIDTQTASGRMLYSILGALSEFEREIIKERVVAGIAAAQRAGKPHGRPAALDHDKTALARRLIAEGQSWNAVARTFGVSKMSLTRAFQRFPEGE